MNAEQPTTPSADARAAKRYRMLFYAAALASVVASVALRMSRPEPPAPPEPAREKDYSFVVDAYGYKYQGHTGNVIDEYILCYGAWEKDHLFFVRDYLKNLNEPNAVVIDVGANTGHHTLFYSRHAAKVRAFEPFPPVIEAIKQNLALNPAIKNVELCEVGLGDANAELPFVAPVDKNHGRRGARRPPSRASTRSRSSTGRTTRRVTRSNSSRARRSGSPHCRGSDPRFG
jgi:FkbM family methyltransferase